MKPKIALVGLGPIAQKLAQLLHKKDPSLILGAVDIDPRKVGKTLKEIWGGDFPPVKIVSQISELPPSINLAVVCTSSTLRSIRPVLTELIHQKINAISTCEEMFFPHYTDPEFTQEINELCHLHGVRVLATGVNPGLLMDTLPLFSTVLSHEIEEIQIERVQDACQRRLPFQQKIGAGLTLDEFHQKVATKTLRHVGLTESTQFLAHYLGKNLDRVKESINPVIAEKDYFDGPLQVRKGQVLGVIQEAQGFLGGKIFLRLYFKAALFEGKSFEKIFVKGNPSFELSIPSGINGDGATAAVIINSIPRLLECGPGLKTMAHLPVPRMWVV